MGKSIMQTDRACYICGRLDGLERHHALGGFSSNNRKLSETYGLWVWVCHEHHTGRNGVQYDKFDPSIIGMNDNQDYCSFFVSYGVDEIDYEVGETVCAGIAKAFTMLLKAAGIESYVMDCG